MVERDPNTWTWGTWALAILIPVAGGIVSWYQKAKRGHTRVFNVIELFFEMFVSGFVGFVVFLGLNGLGYDLGVCAAAGGIGGHMGTRLLTLVEQWFERIASAKVKRVEDSAQE